MNNMNIQLPTFWAMLPEARVKVEQLYLTWLQNNMVGLKNHPTLQSLGVIESADPVEPPETFSIDGNIGVMKIDGVIMQKGNYFTSIFGGAATLDVMTRDFNALLVNDEVNAIVLDISSPGGGVFGVQAFANLVFESRDIKPIFAISSSVMHRVPCGLARRQVRYLLQIKQ